MRGGTEQTKYSISGSLFDQVGSIINTGLGGRVFPCIEGADNARLAKNLIQVISDGVSPPGITWEDAFLLLDETETAIYRITERILRAHQGDDWFLQMTPIATRDKCLKGRKMSAVVFRLAHT